MLVPAASEPFVGETVYFEDVDTILEIVKVDPPVLVTITELVTDLPTGTVPKLRLVGVTENTGLGGGGAAVEKPHVEEYALVPALFVALTCIIEAVLFWQLASIAAAHPALRRGAFTSLLAESEATKAAMHRVAEGDALVIDGRNDVVVAAGGRPVAVVGLDDVIVVDAGDAVLVCKRDRAQDVRKAVEELHRRGRDEVL